VANFPKKFPQRAVKSRLENSCPWRFLKRAIGVAGLWCGAMVLAHCGAARGGVTLAWDPSPDSGVAGYMVYYGAASGVYSSWLDMGTNTVVTVSNLAAGLTYHFVVTAYSPAGVESAPSGEVTYLVPGLLLSIPGSNPGSPVNLAFPVAPRHWYEVQATANLRTWTTVWQMPPATSNAWVRFSDPQAALFQKRFYRLVLH